MKNCYRIIGNRKQTNKSQRLLMRPFVNVGLPDAYGRRDRVLLQLLYNTGARVSELIGIRVRDLELEVTSSVRLHGKGRKQRTVPLWKETVVEIRRWLQSTSLQTEQPLLPNCWGKPMTRSNIAQRIAQRIARAVSTATPQCPSL